MNWDGGAWSELLSPAERRAVGWSPHRRHSGLLDHPESDRLAKRWFASTFKGSPRQPSSSRGGILKAAVEQPDRLAAAGRLRGVVAAASSSTTVLEVFHCNHGRPSLRR